jgi:hypothetical protein
MTIYGYADSIESKEDFVKFLKLLLDNYKEKIEEWDNNDLESYLDGMWGFTTDIEGVLKTQRGERIHPTWKLFARILLAAKVYE